MDTANDGRVQLRMKVVDRDQYTSVHQVPSQAKAEQCLLLDANAPVDFHVSDSRLTTYDFELTNARQRSAFGYTNREGAAFTARRTALPEGNTNGSIQRRTSTRQPQERLRPGDRHQHRRSGPGL